MNSLKKIILLITLMVCALNMSAQTYLDHLQQKLAGIGSVTIVQSNDISNLVNGTAKKTATPSKATTPTKTTANQQATKPIVQKEHSNASKNNQENDSYYSEAENTEVDTSKKLMRNSHKINGYRVQVYAGSNSRVDREKATSIGKQVKQHFPGQPVYVHFQSPRWICRMGNYRTMEEARAFLTQVQALGFSHASIVKGKISVSD